LLFDQPQLFDTLFGFAVICHFRKRKSLEPIIINPTNFAALFSNGRFFRFPERLHSIESGHGLRFAHASEQDPIHANKGSKEVVR